MGRVVSVRPRWTGLCHFDSPNSRNGLKIYTAQVYVVVNALLLSRKHTWITDPAVCLRCRLGRVYLSHRDRTEYALLHCLVLSAPGTNKHRRTYEQLRYKKIDLLWDYGGFLNVVITIHSPSTQHSLCIGQAPLRHSLTRSHQIQKYG